MRFGKLIALSDAAPRIRKDRGTSMRQMSCVCDCGIHVTISVADLKSGNTKSCGCLQVETAKTRSVTHGQSISVDRGGKATSEYNTWRGMLDRCSKPKHISYKWYGARGIKVCDRWLNSFETFLSDMGPKPSRNHSIERNDSDGDYTPENCRWATGKEQYANTRISPKFLAHIRR